jgi:hypothetical protein
LASTADIARVRSFIARELDTINEYAAWAEAAEDPVIKQMLLHVTEEEKEHVAEGMRLLHAVDGGQATRTAAHVDALLGNAAASPAPVAAHAAPSGAAGPGPRAAMGGTLTVGGLRKAR